jgi:hypothetical protein
MMILSPFNKHRDISYATLRFKALYSGSAAVIRRPLNQLLADSFFFGLHQKASKEFPILSVEIEAVKVHHPGPGRYNVIDKLLLSV